MKINTTTTVQYQKGKETITVPPSEGKHDFPKDIAEELLERKLATTLESEDVPPEVSTVPRKGSGAWLKNELDNKGIEYDSDASTAALKKLLADSEAGPEADANQDSDTFTMQEIVDAVAVLDVENEEQWTAEGEPTVEALEIVLKGDITAEQRDAAWVAYTE